MIDKTHNIQLTTLSDKANPKRYGNSFSARDVRKSVRMLNEPIPFSKREEISKEFDKWCEENNVVICVNAFLAWYKDKRIVKIFGDKLT